jgi:hypothetical protein
MADRDVLPGGFEPISTTQSVGDYLAAAGWTADYVMYARIAWSLSAQSAAGARIRYRIRATTGQVRGATGLPSRCTTWRCRRARWRTVAVEAR